MGDHRPATPFDPRSVRYVAMARALTGAAGAAWALAVLGLVLPGGAGRSAGWAAVGVLVAAPAARLLWLVGRWWRRGDRRYVAVGAALVAVLAVALALALR